MKTSSSFLYDLVHSLSKSEKRYLKVQNGNKENDYLVLMNALLVQKIFDENKLKESNKGANFLNNLAVNKRYLFEMLLDTLGKFGEETIEDQVSRQISHCKILIKKELYPAAYSELKKAKKMAKLYELFESQLLIIGLEKKLTTQKQNKSKTINIDKTHLFEEENNCLKQLLNTNEYWFLNQKISSFQMQYQNIQTAEQKKLLDEISLDIKFKDDSLATNTKSRIFLYQANSTFYFINGQTEKAYENNKHFLDFLEAKPNFLKLYAERYLAVVNNLLIDGFGMGKKDLLERGIERLDKIPARKEFKSIKNIEARVFRQKYLLLLNWHLREKTFEQCLSLFPKIEIGLFKHQKHIEKHHRITFYYLSSYLLFLNGKYEQALEWNIKILNESKQDVVKEIFYFARILNLLIHFELKNYFLVDSLLLSIPKYLKARRDIYKTEKALFSFIRKIRNSTHTKEKLKLIEDFKTTLDSLLKDAKERRVFNYLDLRIWLSNFS